MDPTQVVGTCGPQREVLMRAWCQLVVGNRAAFLKVLIPHAGWSRRPELV